MLGKKVEDALNRQLVQELYAASIYYSMAGYMYSIDLEGAARWLKAQSQEEITHAVRFFDYLVDRGGRVRLAEVPAPPVEFDSPLAAFEAANAHEQKVTGLISGLVELARSENDHATENFLQWFTAEQVEEEASTDAVVKKFRLVGEDKAGLFVLDRKLGTRTFTYPAAPSSGGE